MATQVDRANLVAIKRGRAKPGRILEGDQAPSLRVVMDRSYLITPGYVNSVVGQWDADRITWDQMRRMRRHPILAFGLHFIKSTIVNADWHVECEDPQVRAFAEEALKRVYHTTYAEMLTGLE